MHSKTNFSPFMAILGTVNSTATFGGLLSCIWTVMRVDKEMVVIRLELYLYHFWFLSDFLLYILVSNIILQLSCGIHHMEKWSHKLLHSIPSLDCGTASLDVSMRSLWIAGRFVLQLSDHWPWYYWKSVFSNRGWIIMPSLMFTWKHVEGDCSNNMLHYKQVRNCAHIMPWVSHI